MTNKLPVVHEPVRRIKPFIPTSLADINQVAAYIAEGEWAPKSYLIDPREPRKGFSIPKIRLGIMHGMELGLTPIAALQNIAVINGMPCIWGDGALGLVRGSGKLEDFQETFTLDGVEIIAAHCKLKRKGEGSYIEESFTVEDARKAGLWGRVSKDGRPTPWQQYPGRMLRMRARMFALRAGFADILRGLYGVEEIEGGGDWAIDTEARVVAEPVKTNSPPPPPIPPIEAVLETKVEQDQAIIERARTFWAGENLVLKEPRGLKAGDNLGNERIASQYFNHLSELVKWAPAIEDLERFMLTNGAMLAELAEYAPETAEEFNYDINTIVGKGD